ncbi:MAG TPA: winged helix DNA-binding domain-containing protein [Streptosporangiaceae bacterium]|nr:winged helix DNA-binding domain-containing protein [Streptosporangiaceae bacterium]
MTASGIRRISAAQRRARLAVRHRLAPPARASTAEDVARDLVALHGTDPASVYLAVWTRTAGVDAAMISHTLYQERALIRMLGMRRTMFVVPAGSAPVIQAACTDEIAQRLRRLLVKRLQEAGIADDAAGWLTEAGDATVQALTVRGAATGAELSRDVPRLRTQIVVAEGKSYGGLVSIATQVLMLLSAEGRIVRGRPLGGWTSSQYQWQLPGTWRPGRPEDAYPSPGAARTELARRWLLTFGPAPVSDLQWWTGWTAGQAKAALAGLSITEADLDGVPGILLAGDDAPGPGSEPWAALLPALDPTAMGWRERGWFLGEHKNVLFDRSGNIGPTVWWDGRIVGGWAQRETGEVVFRLLEDAGADAREAIAAEAERLGEWLAGTRVTPRFRTPLERELSG